MSLRTIRLAVLVALTFPIGTYCAHAGENPEKLEPGRAFTVESRIGQSVNFNAVLPLGWSHFRPQASANSETTGAALAWGVRERERDGKTTTQAEIEIQPLDLEWSGGRDPRRIGAAIRGGAIGSRPADSDPRGNFAAIRAKIEGGVLPDGTEGSGYFALENSGVVGRCMAMSASSRLVSCLEAGLFVRAGTTTGFGGHAGGMVLYRVANPSTGQGGATYVYGRAGVDAGLEYNFVAEEDESDTKLYLSLGVTTDLVDRLSASAAR